MSDKIIFYPARFTKTAKCDYVVTFIDFPNILIKAERWLTAFNEAAEELMKEMVILDDELTPIPKPSAIFQNGTKLGDNTHIFMVPADMGIFETELKS